MLNIIRMIRDKPVVDGKNEGVDIGTDSVLVSLRNVFIVSLGV
jgi:hypothetical protein